MSRKEVKAIQWEGSIESEEDIASFMGSRPIILDDPDLILIESMVGPMVLGVGDWVVMNPQGCYYVVRFSEFAKHYCLMD